MITIGIIKNRAIVVFSALLVLTVSLLLPSCGLGKREVTDTAGADHLCPDRLYQRAKEKARYLSLKKQMDTLSEDSGCFTESYFRSRKNPGMMHKEILEKYIDNIFFSPNMDTVCVLVAYLARWKGDTTMNRLYSEAIMEIYLRSETDSSTYRQACEINERGFWLWEEGNNLVSLAKDYRQNILKWGIFKPGTYEIDPTFFKRITIPEEPVKEQKHKLPESGPL